VNPLSTDVKEENDQVPSPESPTTEEVQEQIPVAAQVEEEKEEVAVASETSSTTALDEGSSKGFHFILLASHFNSHFSD
jgi:phosphoribosyl-ATP pyrophosphohydrolase